MICGLTMMKIVMGRLIARTIGEIIRKILSIYVVIAPVMKSLVLRIGIGSMSMIMKPQRGRSSKLGRGLVGLRFRNCFVLELMISSTSKVDPFGYHI
jgi:hypothetical protein